MYSCAALALSLLLLLCAGCYSAGHCSGNRCQRRAHEKARIEEENKREESKFRNLVYGHSEQLNVLAKDFSITKAQLAIHRDRLDCLEQSLSGKKGGTKRG